MTRLVSIRSYPLVTLSSGSSTLGILDLITKHASFSNIPSTLLFLPLLFPPRLPPSSPSKLSAISRFHPSLYPYYQPLSEKYKHKHQHQHRHPFAIDDEKLLLYDRDGIIGRPSLFMAFIFLEIARESSANTPRLYPLFTFLCFFFQRSVDAAIYGHVT